MRAVYLVNKKSNVDYVYSKESQERIKRLVDIDEEIYCQEDLEANPEGFKDVEYVFSTWSMPGGGEDKDDFARFFPNCKAFFYAAGSVKYFADHWLDKGIRIFSAFAANAIPVAEYSVAQILLANKGFFHASRMFNCPQKHGEAWDVSKKHCGNYDAKIGIIGAGMIGRKVIELLKPYKLNILVFDKFLSEEQIATLDATKATLEEIFETCDVVSNHLANVPATVGMLNGEHFAKMKEYATFINTGRGAQICEDEMLSVLSQRKDITALLDVTVDEPPVEDSLFYTLENVVLTPHIAGSQANEVQRMSELVVDQFENLLAGKPTQYEITKEMLAKMA
ncbi:MAG: hydroxyacid dehydrogenase [Clostridia bacterium]|nr:hydroxyacid dehydrogenase [Clostridia bacterium]